jgi:hypothetical protein
VPKEAAVGLLLRRVSPAARRRRPWRLLLPVMSLVIAGVGCEPPPVTLKLTLADGLIAPDFVRFVFHLEGGDAIEQGPFSRASLPSERFVEVPPFVSFSVDVIGCLRGVREECEDPTSFVGRGCAGPFSRERDTELLIEVELLPTADGNAACPISP